MPSKPPTVVDLAWQGDLRFLATFPQPSGATSPSLVLDSAGTAGLSPVSALGAALAGCMAIDLAHILTRGRHGFRDIRARLEGERSPEEPHRLTRVTLAFTIVGDVPGDAVRRAIALSRDRYCSVWHSLRQDIEFQVTFGFGA